MKVWTNGSDFVLATCRTEVRQAMDRAWRVTGHSTEGWECVDDDALIPVYSPVLGGLLTVPAGRLTGASLAKQGSPRTDERADHTTCPVYLGPRRGFSS